MATTSASAGALLRHVRTGRARSRAELVALTGASRNTISARVDQLIAANLLEEGGRGWSTGGRPPTILRFNSRAGCVLAVDLGVTSVDVAVSDLSAQILATAGHPIDIGEGPGPVLAGLIGVNLGPNLTYVGSLATLLWRRILQEHDHDAELGEFTRVGLVSVPATLLGATVALWAMLTITGG